MSWIQLHFHRELVPQAGTNVVGYKVTASIDNTSGITPNLFVLQTSDNSYSSAATLYDLLNYPESQAIATGPTPSDFYRVNSVSQIFDRAVSVDDFVTYVKATLTQTNADWATESPNTFGGDDISVIDSNT